MNSNTTGTGRGLGFSNINSNNNSTNSNNPGSSSGVGFKGGTGRNYQGQPQMRNTSGVAKKDANQTHHQQPGDSVRLFNPITSSGRTDLSQCFLLSKTFGLYWCLLFYETRRGVLAERLFIDNFLQPGPRNFAKFMDDQR